MTVKLLSIMAALLLTLFAVAFSPAAGPGLGVAPGHTLLHLNCPPGSHGKPRFDGVGQRLEAARETGRTLAERALTAR